MNMKVIKISVPRMSVLRRVAMTTAYIAVKNEEDGNLCDRLPVVPADSELMEELWSDACAAADNVLRAYLQPRTTAVPSICTEEGCYHATLVVRRCSLAARVPVAAAVRAFLAADLLRRWMEIALPAKAADCRRDAEEAAEQLRRSVAAVPHRVRKYVPF